MLARARPEDALGAARETRQKEWVWSALEARAELEDAGGQPLLARRDREEALATLEGIGARLPRDLREVYWNDPRRRQTARFGAGLDRERRDRSDAVRRARRGRPPTSSALPAFVPSTLASPGAASIST